MSTTIDRAPESLPKLTNFDDVAGNAALKRRLIPLVRGVISEQASIFNTTASNLLCVGDSRSGKTASMLLALRIATCKNARPDHLVACGKCDICVNERLEDNFFCGVFAYGRESRVQTISLDCSRATVASIEYLLEILRDVWYRQTIVYLDEIHRLAKYGADEWFLKPLEKKDNTIWLATTTTLEGLEEPFIKRFVKTTTTKPNTNELIHWLESRAAHLGLEVEDGALEFLATRSSCNPGDALKYLECAQLYNERRLDKATLLGQSV